MERTLPFMTPELAKRLESEIVFFSKQRQEALRAIPGNPYAVQTRDFGGATAFLAQRTYNADQTSHVGGISRDDLSSLEAIFEWYHSYGVHCTFYIAPPIASPPLLWHLAAKGWYQSGFYHVLYGLPQVDTTPHADIVIRHVTLAEQDLFADVYCESFEVPKTDAYVYIRDSIRVLVEIPTNHCFFALIDNTVAAIAVLSVHEQVGYLALSGTRPHFQNRGCQKAMLQARLRKAAQAGCTLVLGQAAVASISQQNMEKAGLHLAYTKVLWSYYDSQKDWSQQPDPMER
ncbi:MAG TPA: GNAT family N-acetyltransferase [Ktedonobacteraceae bacterium]